MQTIGRTVLLDKPLRTPEEVIEKIMAVDTEAAAEIIDRVLDTSTLTVTTVGPIDSAEGLFSF